MILYFSLILSGFQHSHENVFLSFIKKHFFLIESGRKFFCSDKKVVESSFYL